jgi:hypothetical protein
MPEQNKSIGWVVGMLALAVAFFGWGFLAADYFQNGEAGGGGETNFYINAIEQLENFPSVMSFAFSHRLWLIGVIVVLEIGVFFLGAVMKKLDRELWDK